MKRLQEKSLTNGRDEGARRGRQREESGSHRRVVALECLDDERHLRRVDLELPRQQRRGVAPRHQPGLGLVQRDRALLLPRVQALRVPQLSFRQLSSWRTLFLEVSLILEIGATRDRSNSRSESYSERCWRTFWSLCHAMKGCGPSTTLKYRFCQFSRFVTIFRPFCSPPQIWHEI